jgi:hypothetical protein
VKKAEPEKPPRKKRSVHWGHSFQIKLNAWIKGTGQDLEPVLGYSRDDLVAHLERQFSRGMRWENYAGHRPFKTKDKVWVVDHIVPKRLFRKEDVAAAFAITNLRPLWMAHNLQKNGQRYHLV